MHVRLRSWDHEQGRGSSGAAVPAVFAGVSPATNPGARRPGGRRDACPTTARFMERKHWLVRLPGQAFCRANPSEEWDSTNWLGHSPLRRWRPSREGLNLFRAIPTELDLVTASFRTQGL